MRSSFVYTAALFVVSGGVFAVACSGSDAEPEAATSLPTAEADSSAPDRASGGEEGGVRDAAIAVGDAGEEESEAGPGCSWRGAPGQCITTSACTALTGHTSFSGQCPGPPSVECCIKTPSTADNPPVPAGYRLMQQSQVTPEMTKWAVTILNDPAGYPLFATTTKTFGTLAVLARVEWHPPDFQNGAIHRGVTLYVPVS